MRGGPGRAGGSQAGHRAAGEVWAEARGREVGQRQGGGADVALRACEQRPLRARPAHPQEAGQSRVSGRGDMGFLWLPDHSALFKRKQPIRSWRETGLLPAVCSASLFNWSLV